MMAKAKKEKEKQEVNEAPEVLATQGQTDAAGGTVREIPVGDGESETEVAPEVEEEVDPLVQLQAKVAELEEKLGQQ